MFRKTSDEINCLFCIAIWHPFRVGVDRTLWLGRDVGKWTPCGAGRYPRVKDPLTGCVTRKWHRRLPVFATASISMDANW